MFDHWSPAQLAYALGYRINLVGDISAASAYFGSHRKPMSHARSCAVLSRLARMKGIDPTRPPKHTPRALRNGKEQI